MCKFLVALCLAILSQFAYAEPSAKDAEEVHAAISAMFTAIQNEDKQAAFDLQTVDSQQMFGDADGFYQGIKDCCYALHETIQAKIVGAEVDTDTQVKVGVLMIDKHTNVWGAIFIVQKEGGAWKIDQVHIRLVQAAPEEKAKELRVWGS